MSRWSPPRLARPEDAAERVALRADLGRLHRLLRAAWCRETSQDPWRWTPQLPEYAQCAATALIVQDVLGGGLLCGRHERDGHFVSHCWNVFEGAVEVDLTRRQLQGARCLSVEAVRREALLSSELTAYRYAYLAARLAALARRSGGGGAGRLDAGRLTGRREPPSRRAPTSRPGAPTR